MDIVGVLIQLISGATGGNIAGAALKKFSLGPVGHPIVRILGGGLGGLLLGMLGAGGTGAVAAASEQVIVTVPDNRSRRTGRRAGRR